MKKIFLLLFVSVLVFSCTKDTELADSTADLTSTLSQNDDTNIGTYKGLFTTEGMERGVVEITITPGNYATAKINIVNGTTIAFKSNQIINEGDAIQNMSFESTASFSKTAFNFSVDMDGNNVQISNVVYNGIRAGMIAAHDTERAPVVPITGTLACDDCDAHPLLVTGDTGTFSLLYVGDGSGDDTVSAIASVGTVVTTGGSQFGCVDGGASTTCNIAGGDLIGTNDIAWIGTHMYLNGSDCSEAAGTWSLTSGNHGSFTGTFVSDITCSSGPTVLFSEDYETFTGSGFNPSPSAGQLDSDIVIATGMSDGSMAYGDTNESGDFARGSDDDGGVTTGGIYAFNLTGSSNTILGIQPGGSDFTPGTIEYKIENTTGSDITDFTVDYDVFANNDQARANSLNFSYSTDGITFVPVAAADFTSTEASDALGFVSAPRSVNVNTVTITSGSFIYLQFSGNDETGGGSRDEFGIDNLTVTVN